MKKTDILFILFLTLVQNIFPQQIIQLGAYNNNPDFVNKYHLNRCLLSTIGGIRFMDVTCLPTPTVAASLPNPLGSFPMAMEVNGNYAYFGGGMTGYFMIADISNMNSPFQTGLISSINGTGYRIAVNGNYAYMPTNADTLHAIDITNKNAPFVVKRLYIGGQGTGVVVNGSYAYVAVNGVGIRVVNISSPSTMSITTTFPGTYSDLVADIPNNRIFASNGSGFNAISISNPTVLSVLFTGTGGGANGKLEYNNGYVFQVGNQNVSAFQVGGSSATYKATFTGTSQEISVSAKDSVFYFSAVSTLYVLKYSQMAVSTGIDNLNEPTLKAVIYPNPSSGIIKIKQEKISDGTFALFNSLGQEIIRKKISGMIEDVITENLSEGIYYYILTNDYSEQKGKIIIE